MFSQISSVSWCTPCFVWGHGQLTVGGVVPKLGSATVLGGRKISLSAMQTPICQKRLNVRIPDF